MTPLANVNGNTGEEDSKINNFDVSCFARNRFQPVLSFRFQPQQMNNEDMERAGWKEYKYIYIHTVAHMNLFGIRDVKYDLFDAAIRCCVNLYRVHSTYCFNVFSIFFSVSRGCAVDCSCFITEP